LLVVDFGLVAAHIAKNTIGYMGADIGPLAHPGFSLGMEGGFAERFGCLQLLLIVALLLRTASKSGEVVYLSLAFAYLAVFADDAFQIHEQGGAYLAALLDLQPALRLRPQDFGELMTWGVMGFVVMGVVVLGFSRVSAAHLRVGLIALVLLCVLAFFAIAMDMAHVALATDGLSEFLLVTIEEGGELLTITVTCAAALYLERWSADTRRQAAPPGR